MTTPTNPASSAATIYKRTYTQLTTEVIFFTSPDPNDPETYTTLHTSRTVAQPQPTSPAERCSDLEAQLVNALVDRPKAPTPLIEPAYPPNDIQQYLAQHMNEVGKEPQVFTPSAAPQQFPLPISPTIAGDYSDFQPKRRSK
jgi:hypothetical protein